MELTQRSKTSVGSPHPFGASLQDAGINFAIVSTTAVSLTLRLYNRMTREPLQDIPFSPETNRTGDVWHICVHDIDPSEVVYTYHVINANGPVEEPLIDPYAKSISSWHRWGGERAPGSTTAPVYHPFSEIVVDTPFDWEGDTPPNIAPNDLIIYEMHVRGLTEDPSSETKHTGTFLGIIEKIPHLLELGVNAIELLPIQEFNEQEYIQSHPKSKRPLYNYWGYNTINFFSPMERYATSSAKNAAIGEFKTLVKSLHKHGIEVILDVVYNHTGEGNQDGKVYSFKGLDKSIYFMLDNQGNYLNYSGCGNTFNANHPIVEELIINSLRYWVSEMHVDGFRFDLASALTRGTDGTPLSAAPLIKAITDDPVLSHVKLIAEPWDASGLYQVGNFAAETNRWMEWNGKYRDAIRRFIRGSAWSHGEFAMRICGSEDLYKKRKPYTSINFITSHDGFTLADLVSYNTKHNFDNGEDNRDGSNDNESWNCGEEGPSINKKVIHLRERQMRNFHLALLISQGIPMLTAKDEYGHTKHGNNNTWCQDNQLNWFLWDKLKENKEFYRFYRLLIAFRKRHKILRRTSFLTNKDIDWHGIEAFKPEWNNNSHLVAFTLKDPIQNQDMYVAFNAQDHMMTLQIPPAPYLKNWRWVVNTANPSPEDIFENDRGPILKESTFKISSYSAILLIAL